MCGRCRHILCRVGQPYLCLLDKSIPVRAMYQTPTRARISRSCDAYLSFMRGFRERSKPTPESCRTSSHFLFSTTTRCVRTTTARSRSCLLCYVACPVSVLSLPSAVRAPCVLSDGCETCLHAPVDDDGPARRTSAPRRAVRVSAARSGVVSERQSRGEREREGRSLGGEGGIM